MAAKKRAPGRVWIVLREDDNCIPAAATTMKRAIELVEDEDEYVSGPYVLAAPKKRAGKKEGR